MLTEKFIFKNRNPFKETSSYDEWKLYLEYIKESDIVYDIGAHTGWMSGFFCQISKFVYAFEPLTENFQKLVEDTEEHENIKCYRVALSDRNYKSFENFRFWNGGIKQEISYIKFNEFLAAEQIPAPNFIKIDIEGNESIIMPTLEGLLTFAKPIVYVEMHLNSNDFKFNDGGGYDWNRLKDLNYLIRVFPFGSADRTWGGFYDLGLQKDWNPTRNSAVNYLLLPR